MIEMKIKCYQIPLAHQTLHSMINASNLNGNKRSVNKNLR